MADHNYIHSIIPNELDFDIITDFEDNNQLICGASLVIGSTSTLSFKPIQKGIPTVLTNNTGCVGSFRDYRSLVDVDENFVDKVELEMSLDRDVDFIKNTIEGGLEFNSTNNYLTKIKDLMNV